MRIHHFSNTKGQARGHRGQEARAGAMVNDRTASLHGCSQQYQPQKGEGMEGIRSGLAKFWRQGYGYGVRLCWPALAVLTGLCAPIILCLIALATLTGIRHPNKPTRPALHSRMVNPTQSHQ